MKSRHFYSSGNDRFSGALTNNKLEWQRPCFKYAEKMVIADSTLRAFGRLRINFGKTAINSYGGMDILEFICLLRANRLSKDVDLDKFGVRERYQMGRDEFARTRFCRHCKSECMEDFAGELILVVGLNNALKATRQPFVNFQRKRIQNVPAMFKLLDGVLAEMLPKAKVAFVQPLKVPYLRFKDQLEVYAEIETEVLKRNHISIDPEKPTRENMIDYEGVHLYDQQSVAFWKEIIQP